VSCTRYCNNKTKSYRKQPTASTATLQQQNEELQKATNSIHSYRKAAAADGIWKAVSSAEKQMHFPRCLKNPFEERL
jgi:hypothetical protein